MSYCLNPDCPYPHNNLDAKFCQRCGAKLLLGDRYRSLRPIGSGGMGQTFLAVDESIPSKPQCVIKQFRLLDQGSRNLEKAAALFRQEAVRLDDLGHHPQIPALLGHYERSPRQYLVQEFIDGQNLAQELDQCGAFNETKIRRLLNDLLPVLQFIHEHQVIHRDIKPENIIRRRADGNLVLVDFGAAKSATTTSLAKTGTVIGSAGYAAPEQGFGKATFASDIYSLGVTCIHLLTLIPPFDLFDSGDGKWIWRDYLVENYISPELGLVLDKMLESAIARRYQSAEEVLNALNFQPKTSNLQSRISGDNAALMPRNDPGRLAMSYVFWTTWLFGVGGIHRLYNGKIFTGLLWLFTYGLFGIGQLIDLVLLPQIVDEYEEKLRAKLGVSVYGIPLSEPPAIAKLLSNPIGQQQIHQLVKAAAIRQGKISVTQAVMDTGMSFNQVETLFTQLVQSGYVSRYKDIHTGVVIYEFNELVN